MEYEDKIAWIMKHYGMDNQLKHFHSEVYELIEAINKNDDTAHIAEEIADVFVMLEQFINYYNIKYSDIQSIMRVKADRQINRIRLEKY